MANIVKSNKDFKIIKMSSAELMSAVRSAYCICDNCGLQSNEGYYIAVLNMWFCPKCYQSRIKDSTYYIEDKPVEDKNFQYMLTMLKSAGIDAKEDDK